MKLHILTLVLFVMFTAPYAQNEPSVRLALPEQLTKGTLPHFSARDENGEKLFQKRQLQNLAGPKTERVALVFFATWCMPCAKGATMIKDAADELKQNGVLAVFVNVGERDIESIHEWIKRYGDPQLPLIMDTRSQMAGSFGLLEPNGSIIMPKVLVLTKELTPLFLLGTEGDDFPEILWKYNP